MPKTGEPLTRQRVLEAALHLIDQEGLEGFSMRKLGAVLGVEAMSLYNYVENKRALFDGVIEWLIVQAPSPEHLEETPREEVWAFAHAFRDVLRAHPRVLPLVATSPLRTPATLAMLDHLLATFHRAQITSLIVPSNWFWRRKVPEKKGSAPREPMPYGELVLSNWHKHTRRSRSTGWTTPICSLSRSRQRLRDCLTRLPDDARLALRKLRSRDSGCACPGFCSARSLLVR